MSSNGNEVLVVVEVRAMRDAEAFKQYQAGAREQIGRFGGKVIARGSAMFEGVPAFGPLMVQQWPSQEAFVAWQESEDYQPLRTLRRECADIALAVIPLV